MADCQMVSSDELQVLIGTLWSIQTSSEEAFLKKNSLSTIRHY